MREYLANTFVLGMAAAFLWHFYLIATRGSFTVGESSPVVLGLEIALLSGIAIFGAINLVRILRRL